VACRKTVYLALLLGLLWAAAARPEKASAGEDAAASAPAAAPEPHSMTRVSVAPWVVEGEILGVIAAYVYDDAATGRPVDYWEIYDREGELLAVGWFDRLGIRRIAVDRGILEEKDQLEGIFVVVVIDGDAA